MKKTLAEFKEAIGKRESGGNYKVVNKFGFMGKYQFGKARLYDLGYSIDGYKPRPEMLLKKVITRDQFLNDPVLQEACFEKHVLNLKKAIMAKWADQLGTMRSDVQITLSGLIAGAHLKGLGGVKQFLAGNDNSDALGTKVSDYVKLFADYEV